MTLEDLDDLSRLQIPQVHLVVLASGDDPFAAGHAKACGDAKFVVDMTHICFQTARALIIPQANSAIVSGRKDVLRVRRKLHMLAGGR